MNSTERKILIGIRAKLRRGDITEISRLSGSTKQYVSQCLLPENGMYNQKIVDAALKVFREREAKRKHSLEQLKV